MMRGGAWIKGDTYLGPLNSEIERCEDQERHKIKQDLVNVKITHIVRNYLIQTQALRNSWNYG